MSCCQERKWSPPKSKMFFLASQAAVNREIRVNESEVSHSQNGVDSGTTGTSFLNEEYNIADSKVV